MKMPICPYLDCYGELKGPGDCSQCGRPSKSCGACGARVRLFASYCHVCGRLLLSREKDWLTFKGSPGRLGTSRFKLGWTLSQLDDVNPLQRLNRFLINGPCSSLLTHDAHLFALSVTGSLAVLPLAEGVELKSSPWLFELGAPVSTEPTIHRGSYYVAAGHRLFAFTLSDAAVSGMARRWAFNFGKSVPVCSILAVDDSLYVTLAHDPQYKTGSMVRLDGVSGKEPPKAVVLHNGYMPSSAAGTSDGKEVLFLAADTKDVYCGIVAHHGKEAVLRWRRVDNPPSPVDPVHPIAARSGKIFAIFKRGQSLCRIDAESAKFDEMIVQNARRFSLSANGNVLAVTPSDIVMPTRNLIKALPPGHNVVSQPFILGDVVAVMGLGGGDVWMLDMSTMTRSMMWRVPGASGGITVLAPYGDLLVIGDEKGAVTFARFSVKSTQ